MTCNTVTEYSDQDEWSPYIAFPLQNAKELYFSYPLAMKCKSPGHILWTNGSYHCLPPAKEICPVFRKHLHVTLNADIPENIYDTENNNKQITENNRSNQIGSLKNNVQSEKTVEIWDKLRKSCKAKARTRWADSLESSYFLQTLEVEKPMNSNDKYRDVSSYGLQRCICKKSVRDENKYEERLDEKFDNNDDDCSSPCLCPRYFIAKTGVVFGSLEEKQCFDEKMDKMDEVFKSELRTIREQHERLKIDFNPSLSDNPF